jgi:hypothetical protein
VPSVGVITFNAQQRDLIENLLRDSPDERPNQARDEPDGLFVKKRGEHSARRARHHPGGLTRNDKGVVR